MGGDRSENVNRGRALVAGVLTVHVGLLAWGSYVHSPCGDELGFLASGLYHWQTGRFEMYRVNPPLVRMAATFPLAVTEPEVQWSAFNVPGLYRPEMSVGQTVGREYAADGWPAFTTARWACIPFSLLGAWVCLRWASDLYGPAAGQTALCLWCSDPAVLGNAQTIAADVGATAFGALAGYAFWRWLREPRCRAAVGAGVALGLSELCKSTLVILFLLWPVLWAMWYRMASAIAARRLRSEVAQLVGILGGGVLVLNAGYGFDGVGRPLGSFTFQSRPFAGPTTTSGEARDTGGPGNRFAGTVMGLVPVPLPAQYVLGMDEQRLDFERKSYSYLCGEWRDRGWYQYYLFALAIKEPLGTWALLAMTAWLTVRRSMGREMRHAIVLLAPAAAVFLLVSSQNGFSRHMRYVLPTFPYVFIWVSQLAGRVKSSSRGVKLFFVAALGWAVSAGLWVYPHDLSYFNEAVGGPTRGHEYLLDSNVEFGQDLSFVKQWAEDHPDLRPLRVFCRGPLRPDDVGLDTPETALSPGWYAVGVTLLHPAGQGGIVPVPGVPRCNFCEVFRKLTPVYRAGYSINIYYLTQKDIQHLHIE